LDAEVPFFFKNKEAEKYLCLLLELIR